MLSPVPPFFNTLDRFWDRPPGLGTGWGSHLRIQTPYPQAAGVPIWDPSVSVPFWRVPLATMRATWVRLDQHAVLGGAVRDVAVHLALLVGHLHLKVPGI